MFDLFVPALKIRSMSSLYFNALIINVLDSIINNVNNLFKTFPKRATISNIILQCVNPGSDCP